jgi:hypothetical protein
LAEEGDLKPEDLVWTEGMEGWEEANSIEGLEELFTSPPPLPDDPSGKKGEEPPTLPQSESKGGSKATKSEAVSCVHDYDENDVCRKCGWERQELKAIDGGLERKSGKTEDKENTSWQDSLKVIAVLVVLGYFINSCMQGCGSGGSDSGIHAVDSISGGTAYMSHQLQADPRDLSGRMLSGWRVTFNQDLGEDVYYAVEEIDEKESVSIERIEVMLTMDKCKDMMSGNVSTDVPSGSLVIEGFDDILESNDAEAFTQSLTWQAEWQTGLLSRTGGEFDECSGSFE